MKFVLTAHNLHSWNKPCMTKSGDLDLSLSIANELKKRQSPHERQQAYPIIYGGCDENAIKDLKKLYPDLMFIHYSKYKVDKNQTLIMPTLDYRMNTNIEDLKAFYKWALKFKRVIFDISHYSYYYRDIIQLCEDRELKRLLIKLFEDAHLYTHTTKLPNSAYRSELKESDINLQKLEIGYLGQMCFYVPEDKTNRSHNHYAKYPENVTFNRMSRFKGFEFWVQEMLDEPEKATKSVYIGNLSSYPEHCMEMFYRQLKAIGFEGGLNHFHIFNSIKEYLEAYQDEDNDVHKYALPTIISSVYDHDDPLFKELLRNAKTCLVATNYHVLDRDQEPYVVIENAMFHALASGLKLRWVDESVNSFMDTFGQCKTLAELNQLNHLGLEEQRAYFSKHFSAAKFVAKLYQSL